MDDRTRRALAHGQTIDITTTGRRSGEPRRIALVVHAFDGHVYLSGKPRPTRRSWLANLEADPHFAFHLKGPPPADLQATARVITDEAERRSVFARIARDWRGQDVETMVRHSPLVEVSFTEEAAGPSAPAVEAASEQRGARIRRMPESKRE